MDQMKKIRYWVECNLDKLWKNHQKEPLSEFEERKEKEKFKN
tara:strand:- start:1 stop:126 length:126 start_codon:yes stop_codon:yes gene_type:complete